MWSRTTTVKLPGEKDAEFINSIPYTPKSKQNMTALMVARNDGEHYGELILYQFPKSKTIYGPMQVEAQINQNTEISSDFTLWSSKGSSYKRATSSSFRSNPLLYVEPVYLEAENPRFRRSSALSWFTTTRSPTSLLLGEALNALFGEGTSGEGAEAADQRRRQRETRPRARLT